MSIEWNKQSFQALKKLWKSGENKSGLSDREIAALKGRYGEIKCMVESDRIWPPVPSSPARRKFNEAFREVLSRLPEEVFDQVQSEIGFVLEDPTVEFFATNVPAPPSGDVGGKLGIDTIVFFHTCLNFAREAMIGLIAHEIAHSFVRGRDNREDEALVNDKAREWGFGDELNSPALAKEALLGRLPKFRWAVLIGALLGAIVPLLFFTLPPFLVRCRRSPVS
jgi:hypothetical protein